MKKVVIFGILDLAELAHWYIENDSDFEVVAFTAHKKYINSDKFRGLPLVSFESLQDIYPPNEFSLFAPMTGRNMNKLREDDYNEGKEKGYSYISYISSKATVCENIIGENCFILEDNTIQPFTKIGNNVVLWSGNHIGHHSVINDHVFFTSHVVMSGHCVIESNCFFGVNSTIRDYSTISKGTLLAMGACLTKTETTEWGVYVGSPAKLKEGLISHKIY